MPYKHWELWHLIIVPKWFRRQTHVFNGFKTHSAVHSPFVIAADVSGVTEPSPGIAARSRAFLQANSVFTS